jgi:membrane protease YdiL (CAAX protease family)
MMKLVRRYPVTTFFVLAYAITWLVWVPRALVSAGYLHSELPVALGDFWTYGPAIAAILVAALWGGRAGLRELGSRLIRWRVGVGWYALVLVGPAAFWALVLGILTAVGWSAEIGQPMMIEQGVLAVVPLLLVLALTDGLGEEVGWRGYALPRQLERFGPGSASLLLGVVWSAWHLPLFWTDGSTLDGAPFWILLVELPAMSVLYTWVFVNTNGSTLLAVLFHAAWNVCTMSATVAGTVRVALVIVALKWLLAAAVAAWWARSPSGHRSGRARNSALIATPPRQRG